MCHPGNALGILHDECVAAGETSTLGLPHATQARSESEALNPSAAARAAPKAFLSFSFSSALPLKITNPIAFRSGDHY